MEVIMFSVMHRPFQFNNLSDYVKKKEQVNSHFQEASKEKNSTWLMSEGVQVVGQISDPPPLPKPNQISALPEGRK